MPVHNDVSGRFVMLACLEQGEKIAIVSVGLLFLALLLLGLEGLSLSLRCTLLWGSIVCGVIQGWFALRVGFDAALLRMLQMRELDDETAAKVVDAGLYVLGFLKKKAPDSLRSWCVRWRGMRRLLLLQFVFVLFQFMALIVALVVEGAR